MRARRKRLPWPLTSAEIDFCRRNQTPCKEDAVTFTAVAAGNTTAIAVRKRNAVGTGNAQLRFRTGTDCRPDLESAPHDRGALRHTPSPKWTGGVMALRLYLSIPLPSSRTVKRNCRASLVEVTVTCRACACLTALRSASRRIRYVPPGPQNSESRDAPSTFTADRGRIDGGRFSGELRATAAMPSARSLTRHRRPTAAPAPHRVPR